MIIDKELVIYDKELDKIERNTKNLFVYDFSRYQPKILISYVNKQGMMEAMTFDVPLEELYVWRYADTEERYYDSQFRKMVNERRPGEEERYKSWDHKPVKKIPCFRNKNIQGRVAIDLGSIRFEDFRIYEMLYDIDPNKETTGVLYELNIPKTLFWDIEVQVDNPKIFPNAKDVIGAVNCISCCHEGNVWTWGNKPLSDNDVARIEVDINKHLSAKDSTVTDRYKFHYEYVPNEWDLIMKFYAHTKGFPAMSGWNTDGYDNPYLVNRLMKINPDNKILTDFNKGDFANKIFEVATPYGGHIRSKNKDVGALYKMRHKCNYDYLEIYRTFDRTIKLKQSFSLDYTAERATGLKKVEHALGFKELYEKDYYTYILYSAIDPILVEQIDKSVKTSGIACTLGNLVGVSPDATLGRIGTVEAALVQFMYPENIVFPTIYFDEKDHKQNTDYEGAYVYNPVPGIYRYVCSYDFASLYPSVIRQFNISPDTYLGKDPEARADFIKSGEIVFNPNKHGQACKPDEIKTASGAIYTKNFKGMLPKLLDHYYFKRQDFKSLAKTAKQNANDIDNLIKEKKKQLDLVG